MAASPRAFICCVIALELVLGSGAFEGEVEGAGTITDSLEEFSEQT
jgi:hypothetical protein